MTERAFLDTNVLVCVFDDDAGPKQERAQSILAAALARLPVANLDAASVLAAVDRVGRHALSLWDALIVQAAVERGCTRLLTEDLKDEQVVDGVRVENPFREMA